MQLIFRLSFVFMVYLFFKIVFLLNNNSSFNNSFFENLLSICKLIEGANSGNGDYQMHLNSSTESHSIENTLSVNNSHYSSKKRSYFKYSNQFKMEVLDYVNKYIII